MTGTPDPGRRPEDYRPRRGLKLRLLVGALGGALIAAAGLGWLAWQVRAGAAAIPGVPLDLVLLALAVASLIGGLVFAWWLDRGIVERLRSMAASARANDATPLHDPFSASGWGEISDLKNHVSALITRYRQAARAADHLQILERQIDMAREAIENWIETERWATLPPATGPMQALAEALNRGIARKGDVDGQNQEAARQAQGGLEGAIGDARETAEQSERGFVEGTALLTTVRELERLGGELTQTLAIARSSPERDAAQTQAWLEPATEAIRELVDAASGSVDDLAGGLARVQELSDHVHVVGNRATLIALNAMLATRRGETDTAATSTEDLKALAREARMSTDRVQQLAHEIETQVRAAGDRMKAVRERVGERLARLEPPREVAAGLGPDTLRALERVREMITDAARKSERLSAAGERASRSADRLVRRLEEQARDLEGLLVRLSPPPAEAAFRPIIRPVTERRLDIVELESPADAPESSHPRDPRAEQRP